MGRVHRRVILASSLGTLFEWYDFYLYGALANSFGALFFPSGNEIAALLASLATFSAGLLVRPLGAVIFGRVGDLVGRKRTFLITIVVMGLATALVGILPTYAQIGIWAPILLVSLRLAQGLALGGEYGGAATYVAEHAPEDKRAYYTSWIQITGPLGFCLALTLVLVCRVRLGDEAFNDWGWRIPFLVSVLLLAVSVYIRLKLHESPLFAELKAQGRLSRAPLVESFGEWRNLKLVLLALLGAVSGSAVIAYTSQVYTLLFLQNTLRVDVRLSYALMGLTLLIGVTLLVIIGRVSDRIGRKPFIVAGCLLAGLTYIPLFKGVTHYANPALGEYQNRAAITVAARDCHFNLFANPSTPCDRARDFLTKAGLSYSKLPQEGDVEVLTTIAVQQLSGFDEAQYRRALEISGYPSKADPQRINKPMLLLLLVILESYLAISYAPLAAFLVELFPTRIRYSSLSVPYHIGNGWFGGFVPFIATALAVRAGNIYYGLWYPTIVALGSGLIGLLFIRETRGADLRR
jgi:hypothetical protein